MADRNLVREILEALFSTFQVEATEGLLRGYLFGLSDLSLDELRDSVSKAIRECDRLPLPATLRTLCGARSDGDATAMKAWSIALNTVTLLGPYKSVDFEDATINAVIRNLGGWPNFNSRFENAESEKWLRLEFIKAYKSFANSNVNGEVCKALPGLSVIESSNGVREAVPRRIACETAGRIGISDNRQKSSGLLELKKA